MECLVFAHRMSNVQLAPTSTPIPPNRRSCAVRTESGETTAGLIETIEQTRRLCWREAGVSRSPRMSNALKQLLQEDRQLDGHHCCRNWISCNQVKACILRMVHAGISICFWMFATDCW